MLVEEIRWKPERRGVHTDTELEEDLQSSPRPSTTERKIYDRSRKNDEVNPAYTPRDDWGKYNGNTDECQSTPSGGDKITQTIKNIHPSTHRRRDSKEGERRWKSSKLWRRPRLPRAWRIHYRTRQWSRWLWRKSRIYRTEIDSTHPPRYDNWWEQNQKTWWIMTNIIRGRKLKAKKVHLRGHNLVVSNSGGEYQNPRLLKIENT